MRGSRRDAWVAEEPVAHLMPHIRRAVERDDSPWTLVGVMVEDAVLEVTLRWEPRGDVAALRADALALAGSFAESNTFVRQERRDGATLFEVTTGMIDGDGQFAGHVTLCATRSSKGGRATRERRDTVRKAG